MGFSKWVAVSGQTYTRKIDYQILRCVRCLLCFAPPSVRNQATDQT